MLYSAVCSALENGEQWVQTLQLFRELEDSRVEQA
eukprot:CAMPEP_0177251106 /NCGR_PEP_ID=MMETSP0367-20130122/53775_1 /TAXON_ID=447022 ORGANISM="Scrippsiella hangoei-like, Strain SHHI-4" /NCGR_SAMPLE_ID=MMETSP0367 /ASSEMBLY_ACC=CAM_ASM_000362 /LENGTH=34 /DNA_ID= /DNA_START= /DNA_END= /DNA_ORIENTATION=